MKIRKAFVCFLLAGLLSAPLAEIPPGVAEGPQTRVAAGPPPGVSEGLPPGVAAGPSAGVTAGLLEKMSVSPAFAATVVKNGGRAAAAMGNIADYALSLCALTPHPEWDSWVRLCYEAYERAPDTRMTLYIRGTERNRAEELINISHYINNEFGYARGIYVNVYRLENGRFAMGFDSTAHQTKTRQDFYYEAETMKSVAASLKGGTETETLQNIFRYVKENYPRADYQDEEDPRNYYYGWFTGHPLICNGRAKMVSMLARHNGLRGQVVFGFLNGGPHAWAEVYADGVLWQCDPSMQEALRESLPGNYAREPGWPALKNQ